MAENELDFFRGKLLKRGFADDEIYRCLSQVVANFRDPVAGSKPAQVRNAYLKVRHSSNVNYSWINRMIMKYSHIVPKSKVSLAVSVQPNLFRKLYRSTWSFKDVRVFQAN